ncbi:MAG: Guanylate kinase [Syntrophomonadaceae bacterium]|nr:Guanylate kinase [Bacillota bacterium]
MFYVIIGPSGAGKTSLVECLLGRRPSNLTRVVTATTRTPRQGEAHGREYLFLSQQEFSQTQVLAATKIDGEDYGIPISGLNDHVGKRHDQIIVLDVAGAREIKKAFGENAKVIFISAGYMALKD